MQFSVVSTSGAARAGMLGDLPTPAFMPVATHGHVRNLTNVEMAGCGAGMCLANTYHLYLRPGLEVIERFKGLHGFMQWERGILTDSGGFQIFSLPGERAVTEKGAWFKSPYNDGTIELTPEKSIAIQQTLGSNVMMVLDVCVPSTSDEATTADAMHRTHRWALRSLAARTTSQKMFAIVQGGVVPALRSESAGFLREHPFDGFAIGGLAVGESRELLYSTAAYTAPLLPADKPRYLMGVGTPIDLVEAVNAGCDMFDCILPSKMAQQTYAYTFHGTERLVRAEHRLSDAPIEDGCACPVCTRYTRGYLRHLCHGNHAIAARLLTEHNLWHYQALMRRMRQAIVEGRWAQEYKTLRESIAPKSRVPKSNDFEVVTTKGGARSVRHNGHGEVMHPVGPWEEANALYVEQTRLAERLQKAEEPLRILDVGLGAGTNAVAALTCAAKEGRPLEIVSLELDLAPLQLAIDEGLPYLSPWRHACEAILRDGRFDSPLHSWRVVTGDALQTLDEAEGSFDLCFFDPFSPVANPSLWTVDFVRRIRGKAPWSGMDLVTYSAATPTRVMFLLAGFFVGHGAPTGTKKETTFCSTRRERVPVPLAAEWLGRWTRSNARGAHDIDFSDSLATQVRSHPQFA